MLAALLCNLSQPSPAAEAPPAGGWRVFDFEDRQRALRAAYEDALETFEELPATPAAIAEPFVRKSGRPDFDKWAADIAAAQAFIRWHRMMEDETTAITLMVLM